MDWYVIDTTKATGLFSCSKHRLKQHSQVLENANTFYWQDNAV